MVSASLIWVSERESMDNPSETTEAEGKPMQGRQQNGLRGGTMSRREGLH
jgi:hypothetical protein